MIYMSKRKTHIILCRKYYKIDSSSLSSPSVLLFPANNFGIGTFGNLTLDGFGNGKFVRISSTTSCGLLTSANAFKNGIK